MGKRSRWTPPHPAKQLTAAKPDPNTTCRWTKCGKPRHELGDLCVAHLEVAHNLYIALLRPDLGITTRVVGAIVREPEPEPTPEPPKMGTVYYLRNGAYIKIGWTTDLDKRMRTYAPDSLLLATEPGTLKLEARRHKQFATHRARGREWFAMTPPVMEHITRTAKEHGDPDPTTFAARPVQVPQPRPKSYVGGNRRGNGLIGNPRNPFNT